MSTVPIAGPRRLAPVSRRYAVAWVYLVCFAAVQVAYALLAPRAQATFVTWHWGNSLFARSYSTSVNTSTDQHLHMYCGHVFYGGLF